MKNHLEAKRHAFQLVLIALTAIVLYASFIAQLNWWYPLRTFVASSGGGLIGLVAAIYFLNWLDLEQQ